MNVKRLWYYEWKFQRSITFMTHLNFTTDHKIILFRDTSVTKLENFVIHLSQNSRMLEKLTTVLKKTQSLTRISCKDNNKWSSSICSTTTIWQQNLVNNKVPNQLMHQAQQIIYTNTLTYHVKVKVKTSTNCSTT